MLCKTQRLEEVIQFEDNLAWAAMVRALRYAAIAEEDGRPIPLDYLLEFDKTITAHWEAAGKCLAGQVRVEKREHWASEYLMREAWGEFAPFVTSRFDSVMVSQGIASFFPISLPMLAAAAPAVYPISSERATQLLHEAVWHLVGKDQLTKHTPIQTRYAKICVSFLSCGANPNDILYGKDATPWHRLLQYARRCVEGYNAGTRLNNPPSGFAYTTVFSKLLASLVSHGADVNAITGADEASVLSALDVVERLHLSINRSLTTDDPFSYGLPLEESASPTSSNGHNSEMTKSRDQLMGLLLAKGARKHEQQPVGVPPVGNNHLAVSAVYPQKLSKMKRRSIAALKRLSGMLKEK